MKRNKVTMTDIARRLGLSQPYVSKIIHGKEPNASEETRRRVLDLVEELGYQPDYVASSLRSGRKMCIGVGGSGSLGDMHRYSPAWVYSGIGEVADAHKYYLTFFPLDSELEDSIVRIAKSRMVDGMVFVIPSFLHDIFAERKIPLLHKEGMPFVLVHYDTLAYDCHNVGYDRTAAGRLAARALVNRGIIDFGFVERKSAAAADGGFWTGVTDAAAVVGRTVRDLRFEERVVPDASHGYEVGIRIARAGNVPPGLIVHNDLLAAGLVKAFRKNGIRVPRDCTVVAVGSAFNDGFLGVPELPTVDMPFTDMGRRAAELLFRVLQDGDGGGQYETVAVAPRLIEPDSSRQRKPNA